MNDNRQAIEMEVKELMMKSLADEKLDTSVMITQVLVRFIMPADSVVESANELVRSKNEYKQKEVEVQTAKKETERIAAMANMRIADAIANRKVNKIVIPLI
jgi:hypothetical protein